jgi:hypothetical protein
MNIKTALKIFDLDTCTCSSLKSVDETTLKKKYHELSRKYHPDKNITDASANENFQRVKQAYDLLKETKLKYDKKNMFETKDNTKFKEKIKFYFEFFIDAFINNNNSNSNNSSNNNNSNSNNNNSNQTQDTQDAQDDETKVGPDVDFVNVTNNDVLMENKRVKIENREKNEIVIFPTLDDLIKNNIYKLEYDGQFFYVPMWHDEVYFDNCNLVVKCKPVLSDSIAVDDENNLIVNKIVRLSNTLLQLQEIEISIGKVDPKKIFIPLRSLSIVSTIQTFTFYGEGISKINEVDIYNIEHKSNIVVNIQFV